MNFTRQGYTISHTMQVTVKCLNVLMKVLTVVVLLCQVLLLPMNAAWEMASGLMMKEAAWNALVNSYLLLCAISLHIIHLHLDNSNSSKWDYSRHKYSSIRVWDRCTFWPICFKPFQPVQVSWHSGRGGNFTLTPHGAR